MDKNVNTKCFVFLCEVRWRQHRYRTMVYRVYIVKLTDIRHGSINPDCISITIYFRRNYQYINHNDKLIKKNQQWISNDELLITLVVMEICNFYCEYKWLLIDWITCTMMFKEAMLIYMYMYICQFYLSLHCK